MKISRSISLLLLMLSLIGQELLAQSNWKDNYKTLQVIASSGLSMRSAPDLKSKRILAIPFGKSVSNHGQVGAFMNIGGVVGKWTKITYKGKTGYVFGAYLDVIFQLESTSVNKEVRMDFGSGCSGDVNFDPNLHWYGIYAAKSRNTLKRQKIKPQMLTSANHEGDYFEMSDYALADTNIKKRAHYMIGLDKEINPLTEIKNSAPESWMNLIVGDTLLEFGDSKLEVRNLHGKGARKGSRGSYIPLDDTTPCEVIFYRDGKSQVLQFPLDDWENGESSEIISRSINDQFFLDFAGDLDGDGFTDLLFNIGGDQSSQVILFLSSYAKQGELLKAVAKRGRGSCC